LGAPQRRANLLEHRIATRFSLSEVAEAHELIEAEKVRGCLLVTMN